MKTIVWDVDDVLNDLMASWFNYWKQVNKSCGVSYMELIQNPPDRVLGISIQQHLSSLDEFRLSDNYRQMQPVKEVFSWFKLNGNRFRHIALTAVPYKAAAASAQWVLRNYGKWIRTFHFVPSKRSDMDLPVYDENKVSFMKWLGKIDLFIDDSQDQVQAASEAGIRALLFPRPWNKGEISIAGLLADIESL